MDLQLQALTDDQTSVYVATVYLMICFSSSFYVQRCWPLRCNRLQSSQDWNIQGALRRMPTDKTLEQFELILTKDSSLHAAIPWLASIVGIGELKG